MVITEVAVLDELLQQYAPAIGRDFAGYRNHCYRMLNFCAALSSDDAESLQKIGIAAAFHDLGIWSDNTFDYLDPSEQRAQAYLAATGRTAWTQEIGAMIQQHHKITRYPSAPKDLVEAFRKADLVDVSVGMVGFGLPRKFRQEVFAAFPNAGFHKCLARLFFTRLRSHPLSPMPMMRL